MSLYSSLHIIFFFFFFFFFNDTATTEIYTLSLHDALPISVLQRHSVQKLHGDEGLPMLIVNFVDGADVRMVQRGSRLRLALKAGQSLRVLGNLVRQELQGSKAAQLYVLGL